MRVALKTQARHTEYTVVSLLNLSPIRAHSCQKKVARIELRVVGIRSIGSTVSTPVPGRALQKKPVAVKPRIISPMRITAEWNGDFAAAVDLPASNIDEAKDRSTSSFPAAQDSRTIGENTSDGFIPLGREAVRCRAENPWLIVLPMHVPSVMETTDVKKSPGGRQPAGRSFPRRGSRIGHGAHTYGGGSVKTGGGYSGANGGGSHCLRVTVAGNPASTCSSRTAPGTVPKTPTNGDDDDNKTEARFFERDLLRKEWTQILVPVPLGSPPRLFDRPNLNHAEGGIRPGLHSSGKNVRPVRRPSLNHHQHGHQAEASALPSNQHQHHGHQAATSPEVFVVLQARAAGFHPQKPPLWLVRRDFAERAVRRIVSAAAAAVKQPRVEVTLLGLRGAVDSLLVPENLEENKYDRKFAVHHQKGSSLPTKNEPELNAGREEILCQAFWNGKIVHSVRLRRTHPRSRVERSRPTAVPDDGALFPSNPTTTTFKSKLGDEYIRANEFGYPGVSATSPAAAATGGGNSEDRHIVAEIVGGAQAGDRENKSRDQDPASWFSNNGLPHLDSWVSVGTPPPNEIIPQRRGGEMGLKHPPRDAHSTGDVQRKQRPGTSANQHGTGEKRHHHASPPPPLAWIPAEADTCNGRAIRFFFPACLFGDAVTNKRGSGGRGSGRAELGIKNVIDHEKAQASSSDDDWKTRGDDALTGESSGTEGTMVRGDLRLVFWLVSSAPDRNNGALSARIGRTRSFNDSRGEMVVGHRLLGCARLIDDELVLQPPGERVELALSGSAGLDTPEEWAMSTTKPKR